MRKSGFVFLFISFLLCSCGSGNDKQREDASLQLSDTETSEISFTALEHDFGKVEEGEKVAFIFSFENKGPGNLVITSASTSCGCTVPKYDKRPIPPGEGGSLEVVFNTSGYNGMQIKTITVGSNSKTPVTVLKIIAYVTSS